MVCKEQGFSINLKTCKIEEFGCDEVQKLRYDSPIYFHQQHSKYERDYIINKFSLVDNAS
jgi:hypothetical protein